MYKIPFSEINILFDEICKSQTLYIPEKKNGVSLFSKRTCETEYDYYSLNTIKSVKDFFFPQTEDIAQFRLAGKTIEIEENINDDEKFVLFGVRSCDAVSLEILDRVFLSEPCDPYYMSRRENGIVIATACNAPEETCFCTSFGIKPWQPTGDVSSWITGDFVYLKGVTEKGNELLEKIKSVLMQCDESEIISCKENIKAITEKLPLKINTLDYWTDTEEKEIFASEQWDCLYKGCLGCGTCTFVCPTCQCYDIRDFDSGKSIRRYRCWDSCMYSDFTKMAHGNPRKTQKERFRQRFMHKLKYYPQNNDGIFSCVGCGRCVRSCPSHLNIVKVAGSVANG